MTQFFYRNIEDVNAAVIKLLGEEDTGMRKIVTGVSQTLRAKNIAQELDGYVKKLSWYLEDLTVHYDITIICSARLY